MRRSALFCLVLALAGCNMVTTADPLFTKADEAGAPRLKPGVWAGPQATNCVFDERTAADTWPSCASVMVVGQGTLGSYDQKDGAGVLTRNDYILTGGEPPILQFHDVPEPGTEPGAAVYFYATLRPLKSDDQGLVTAFRASPVLCGPPPPENASKDGKQVFGTLKPMPGMVMDKDGDDCATDNVEAVRTAAAASAQWESDDITNLHWVRDGDR